MEGLNERQRRFAELYVSSPLAGKQSECVKAAGYNPTDGESASAMGHRLKKNPRVRAYIEKLIAENVTAAAKHLLPWHSVLPAAQALQLEAIATARAALKRVQVPTDDGTVAVDLERISGPLAGLLKAGLQAAETVEAYGLGKPVTRTEHGQPGEFTARDLQGVLDEIRDTFALLRAAGMPVEVILDDEPRALSAGIAEGGTEVPAV